MASTFTYWALLWSFQKLKFIVYRLIGHLVKLRDCVCLFVRSRMLGILYCSLPYWTRSLPFQLHWWASQLSGSACLWPAMLGLQALAAIAGFLCTWWDSNSGSHGYRALKHSYILSRLPNLPPTPYFFVCFLFLYFETGLLCSLSWN